MGDMAILFGRPLSGQRAEDGFEHEALAAEELGIEGWAIPLEPVVNEEAARALAHLPNPSGRRWLYRGWMLSHEEYTDLYDAMLDRGEQLVVDPASFELATYLPHWAPLLEDHTPPSRWIEGVDLEEAWQATLELGPPPWLIKDHVKSAKEQWHEACYIAPGSDRAAFVEACKALIEHRGDRFERGIVIRHFVDLAPTRYRIPERALAEEHRIVFWQGAPIAHAPYHDMDIVLDDVERFAFIGELIDSPFFTADVARLAEGGWTVVELNDGGSSTLPELLDPRPLYRQIMQSEELR
jgi:ATP-grasp domain, R2K clade family 3